MDWGPSLKTKPTKLLKGDGWRVHGSGSLSCRFRDRQSMVSVGGTMVSHQPGRELG
jgi:hypothetical protein